MKNILFFALFVVLYGCGASVGSQPAEPRRQFRTNSASRLYFQNMRAYFYEQKTDAKTKVDFYTLKKYGSTENPPLLTPIIVDNWLADEAYIFLEKNPALSKQDTLQLIFEKNDTTETLKLADWNTEQQLELAISLGEALEQGHKINVYTNNSIWQPVFENQADMANFLKIMADYQQLVKDYTK